MQVDFMLVFQLPSCFNWWFAVCIFLPLTLLPALKGPTLSKKRSPRCFLDCFLGDLFFFGGGEGKRCLFFWGFDFTKADIYIYIIYIYIFNIFTQFSEVSEEFPKLKSSVETACVCVFCWVIFFTESDSIPWDENHHSNKPAFSGWRFQIFFIFIPIWGNDPIWLIFFRWVCSTTN